MMTQSVKHRWRKVTDVNRETALFELLEGEVPILDIGFSNENTLEVAFNPGIAGSILSLETFVDLLSEGRGLAEQDR